MAIQFTKKHLLALIFVFCLFLFVTSREVFAKSYGLTLTPTVILIAPQKDGLVEKEISVQNSGRDPIVIEITPQFFHAGKDGEIQYVPSDNLSEREKLLITQGVLVLENDIPISSLTLAPGQKQSLKLQITIKDIQKISENTFSLLFLAKSDEVLPRIPSEESPINAGLGITLGSAVHVLIAGQSTSSKPVTLSSFTAKQFIQQGPVDFHAEVKNNNDKYINIYGNITITNMFGQQVGLIRIPNQVLLSGSKKELRSNTSVNQLIWDEKFLLGPYKAKITLFDDYGQNTTSTSPFFAFPIRTSLLVLIGLLIASFLIGEIRKRVR